METFKKLFAEFIGTMVLVLIGCGTAAAVGVSGTGYLLTALAFGLALTAMVYCVGCVSGCHINPAVSFAMLLSGRMGGGEFIGYILAQFLGGTAGAALLLPLLGDETGLGANALFDGNVWLSVLVEIILTCIFVLVVLSVTAKEKFSRISGVSVGLTLCVVHIFGIYFTGTSVNPARSFGPALFVGGDALKDLWVFIVAPLVGAAIAAILYKILYSETAETPQIPETEEEPVETE